MQIFQGVQMSRPVPYDRNGIVRVGNYFQNLNGPQATTQVIIYTVPAGKRAFLDWLSLYQFRNAISGPLGTVTDYWEARLATGPITVFAYIQSIDNTVGHHEEASVTGFGYLGVGDKLEGYLADNGSGGPMTHNLAYKIMEFDP